MERTKLILIVDDEPPIRRVLELMFKNGGYQTLLAANGEEALIIIERDKPDAVITDINMPRMNGRKLCELTDHLKRERPFLTIIMTARIMPDEQQWIEVMHETMFMEKPFSPTRLRDSIDRYFGVQR